jgi:pilus assembly protein FimV
LKAEPTATTEDFMATSELAARTLTNVTPAVPAAATPAAAPSGDPLAEVNVYLAYERFEQAEQLVQQAIDRDPTNLNYRMRLLEVYYSSNNKAGYENAARAVYDATGGSGEQWDSAVAMWNEMSPERALFAAGAVAEAAPAAPASQFVDITSDLGEVGAATLTIKPGESTEDSLRRTIDRETGAEEAADAQLLDITGGEAGAEAVFDITSAGPATEEAAPVFDLSGGELADTGTGELFDLTGGKSEAPSLEFDLAGAEPAAATDKVLDITAADAVDVLDITGGAGAVPTVTTATDDLLDVTHTGELSGFSQSDLLNVTASGAVVEERPVPDAGISVGPEPEIIDITGAPEPTPADSLIEFDISVAPGAQSPAMLAEMEQPVEEEIAFDISVAPGAQSPAMLAEADKPVEEEIAFDISVAPGTQTSDGGGDGLDIDIGDLSLDAAPGDDAGAEVMFDVTATGERPGEDDGLQIDISEADLSIDGASATGTEEIGVDTNDLSAMVGDLDLEIIDEKAGPDDTLALQGVGGGLIPEDDVGIDLDLTDEFQPAHVDTVRMDQAATQTSTRGEEQTVIMPRGLHVEEQSQEDEVDTKLNLAKAYIELGDGDGARAILDEVVASGNPVQRQEARRLLEQL